MKTKVHRSISVKMLALFFGLILAAGTSCCNIANDGRDSAGEIKTPPLRNKIALNSFSFNSDLSAGNMDLFDLLDFCSELGIEAVDLTGYYFPGYPEVPSDEYIYSIKKRAFELGLDICGTGVKNDFCNPDPDLREKDKELIKNWILVAEKLGAPGVRIMQGPSIEENHPWDEMAGGAAEVIQECAEFGKEHGVMLVLQNHNNFLKTADDVIKMLELINHDWVGLMLDIGSYRTEDPYSEIEKTIQYANTWQLKENVFINGIETPVDLLKLKGIIANSDYKGYLPIETLGEGDPATKVKKYYKEVIAALK